MDARRFVHSISNICGGIVCQEQALGLEGVYGLGDFPNIGFSAWIAFSQGRARIGHRLPLLPCLGKWNELTKVATHGSRDIGADGPACMGAEWYGDVWETDASEIVSIRVCFGNKGGVVRFELLGLSGGNSWRC